MSSVEYLREFVNERLTAAAEEIFGVFIKTVVEYEEEIDRQRRLLDTVLKPDITLNQTELPQQHVCKQQEVLAEQQLCIQVRNSSLDQEDPEPPQIKEEEEEPCTSQEGEQLVLMQETDAFMWTPSDEESDHSEDLNTLNTDETQTEVEEMPLSFISVKSSLVPEPNDHDKLLYHYLHEAESQDHKGDNPEPTREPEQQSQHQKSNSHTNSVFNPTMSNHCDTHTGKASFKCDTCGKAFKYKSEFDRHMLIHTGEKPYVCQICGKAFNHGSHLQRHLMIHSGEKPYSCKTCGKRYSQTYDLKAHMRIHTGEAPYSCKTCGKDFKCSSHLIVHMRTHTGERPYSCKTCGHTFTRKSDLNSHVRIHTGEKPYSCRTCGETYRWKNQLTVHMRTHALEGSEPLEDLQENML